MAAKRNQKRRRGHDGRPISEQPQKQTIKYNDPCDPRLKYEGCVLHDQFHSYGKLYMKSKGYYDGNWHQHKRCGFGVEIFPPCHELSYCFYEGYWSDDFFHGLGKLATIDGHIYDGTWDHGLLLHGVHEFLSASSEIRWKYDGCFQGGLRHGRGRYCDNVGFSYEGDWVEGKRHGHGTLKYTCPQNSEEFQYVGDFYVNKLHGHGTLTSRRGLLYEGEWKDGKKHGHGLMFYDKSDPYNRYSYIGGFVHDVPDGSGITTYQDHPFYAETF